MRPTSNGQTARDVRASSRQWRAAVAAKLEIPHDVIARRTAECLDDTMRFLARLGLPAAVATSGACVMCGREPTHGTVMVDDACSRCWRQA